MVKWIFPWPYMASCRILAWFVEDEDFPGDPEERAYWARLSLTWRTQSDTIEQTTIKGQTRLNSKGLALMCALNHIFTTQEQSNGATIKQQRFPKSQNKI